MPRLSLYKPDKGNDYKFLDRQISEMFTVGGTDIYIHKYLGPKNPTEAEATADQPRYEAIRETNIQDLLLLENRDRVYDTSIYRIRGVYNVQDIDFNLSQFGLFIDNDTLFMMVHINDIIKILGRKPLSGDVIELPHLKDEFALNNKDFSLPRYYVIEEVGRASTGFSATWWPHLYRLKLRKITDSQQFADILTRPADEDANYVGDWDSTTTYTPGQIVRHQGQLYTVTTITTNNEPPNTNYFSVYGGSNIQSVVSTRLKDLEVNESVLQQAEADAPSSGYETRQFFTLAVDETTGVPLLQTADETAIDASVTGVTAAEINEKPKRSGYTGYLLGDGVPMNGADFGHGITFPENAVSNDYYLRTDFLPNRLFRFDGTRWIKVEDSVRVTMTNTDTRNTQKTSFINNTNTLETTRDGSTIETIDERQALSKALKPKADL